MRKEIMSELDKPPSRVEIIDKLKGLISGKNTREEVSSWASVWAFAKADDVSDQVALEALERLASADLVSTDRPYLYQEADFVRWLEDIEQ